MEEIRGQEKVPNEKVEKVRKLRMFSLTQLSHRTLFFIHSLNIIPSFSFNFYLIKITSQKKKAIDLILKSSFFSK